MDFENTCRNTTNLREWKGKTPNTCWIEVMLNPVKRSSELGKKK